MPSRPVDRNALVRRARRVFASPRARRALERLGLDPEHVSGTGPSGRIVEDDVLRAECAPRAQPKPQLPPRLPAATNAPGSLSTMRRAVAAKVTESFTTIPHFYLGAEADVTALLELRGQIVEQVEQDAGVRVTVTDFLLRAMTLALRDTPRANRIWQNDMIVDLPTTDVGLVVQGAGGLMVPVIHEADRLGLVDLARRRAELVTAARSGKLPGDALQGGATSLSNLGRHRVDRFAPIISSPQSSMLAVGRAAPRPAVFVDRLCIRQTLHLTLSVDHRIMDGAPAAEFLQRIVELLERPLPLFCE